MAVKQTPTKPTTLIAVRIPRDLADWYHTQAVTLTFRHNLEVKRADLYRAALEQYRKTSEQIMAKAKEHGK